MAAKKAETPAEKISVWSVLGFNYTWRQRVTETRAFRDTKTLDIARGVSEVDKALWDEAKQDLASYIDKRQMGEGSVIPGVPSGELADFLLTPVDRRQALKQSAACRVIGGASRDRAERDALAALRGV